MLGTAMTVGEFMLRLAELANDVGGYMLIEDTADRTNVMVSVCRQGHAPRRYYVSKEALRWRYGGEEHLHHLLRRIRKDFEKQIEERTRSK
jgi:hypothetical protein